MYSVYLVTVTSKQNENYKSRSNNQFAWFFHWGNLCWYLISIIDWLLPKHRSGFPHPLAFSLPLHTITSLLCLAKSHSRIKNLFPAPLICEDTPDRVATSIAGLCCPFCVSRPLGIITTTPCDPLGGNKIELSQEDSRAHFLTSDTGPTIF